MSGRRAIIGLCILCALVFHTLAAQGTAAASTGTTAFTCKPKASEGGTGFSKPHCKPADAAGSGAKYEHVEVAQETTTQVTGNNKNDAGESIPGIMAVTLFGTTIELTGSNVEGEGWVANGKDPVTGEHYSHGEGVLTFTQAKVLKPANCQVTTDVLPGGEKGEPGVVHTEVLKATTQGQGDRVKIQPKEGTVFGRFWITGASCPITGTYTVTGSITGVPDGSTGSFTEADTTAQNTLKMNGAKVGLSGTVTSEARDPSIAEDTYKPLSTTTVETP